MDNWKPRLFSSILIVVTLTSALLTHPMLALPELTLICQTDKSFYFLGDLVKVSGIVSNSLGDPIQLATIGIEVRDYRSNTIFIDGVWTQANGYYEDSFRLQKEAPTGQYNVYVTASRQSYESTSKQTTFYASNQQLGNTRISISSQNVTLETGNIVKAVLNVTMFSTSIKSTVVSDRFLLSDPKGNIIHDNFNGVGTPKDNRLAIINNDSITSINFQYTLAVPLTGYYAYMFSVYDGTGTMCYASTSWAPAFLYSPQPIYTQDLGAIGPDAAKSTPLSLSLKRFEIALFKLTLSQPLKNLNISLGANKPCKFLVVINQSDSQTQQELDGPYLLAIFNLPQGAYDIRITGLSDVASASYLDLQSDSAIAQAAVSIVQVEATSKSATPSGTIGYHVYVKWTITVGDILTVSVSLEGSLSDSQETQIAPLHYDESDTYLTVTAPSSTGTYGINIEASLKQASVSAQYPTSLIVRTIDYNVTVINHVTYYRDPSCWEWLKGAGTRKYYDDKSQLSVLDVTGITVVSVETDENENPSSATIEFNATNKAGSFLSFGDGPHYEVFIQDSHGTEFRVGLALAGQPPEKYRATLPIGPDRKLEFTIEFKMSAMAEIILLAESAFETVVNACTEGWTGPVLVFLGDVVKLTALYSYKIATEKNQGFMNPGDITLLFHDVIQDSDLAASAIDCATEVMGENNRNPFFAILDAAWSLKTTGKIDVFTWATMVARVFVALAYYGSEHWGDVVRIAFEDAGRVYSVPITFTWDEMGRVEEFVHQLGLLFSILKMVKIITDTLTYPPEEGKAVDSTVNSGAGVTIDPRISVNYSGPASNTTVDYFGDVYAVEASTTQTAAENATGQIVFTVDPNMTSAYLPIVSSPTYQKNLLKSFGLNATSTNLVWQNGTNTFLLNGNGSMFEGLDEMSFSLNSAWIEGSMEMAGDAVQTATGALLNVSLIYPFGKNLTHTIRVTLPQGSTNIMVLSLGDHTISNNVITWTEPVDRITVEFAPPMANLTGYDISGDTQGCNVYMNDTYSNGTAYYVPVVVAINNTGLAVSGAFNVSFSAYWTNGGIQESYSELRISNLKPGENTTLTFLWCPAHTGYYSLTTVVDCHDEVPESSECDHVLVLQDYSVALTGDLNCDHTNNVLDIVQIGLAWHSHSGEPYWNVRADLNHDGYINILDIIRVTLHWHETG